MLATQVDGSGVLDRGAAEFHDNHERTTAGRAITEKYSSTWTFRSFGVEQRSAAAAPRMVLCESTVELPVENAHRGEVVQR